VAACLVVAASTVASSEPQGEGAVAVASMTITLEAGRCVMAAPNKPGDITVTRSHAGVAWTVINRCDRPVTVAVRDFRRRGPGNAPARDCATPVGRPFVPGGDRVNVDPGGLAGTIDLRVLPKTAAYDPSGDYDYVVCLRDDTGWRQIDPILKIER
jgi:hypothetical protein